MNYGVCNQQPYFPQIYLILNASSGTSPPPQTTGRFLVQISQNPYETHRG